MYNNGFNQSCTIGKNTTISATAVFIEDKNAGLVIGEDCMFSYGIVIRCADSHSIINKETGKVINAPNSLVTIGNNCWVGQNVTICKNARIPNNSIIGIAAVCTKSFEKEFTAIVGNPARVVKENITWDRKYTYEYDV